MYFIIGRFGESVEDIQILRVEDERDLQMMFHGHTLLKGVIYRDAKQFENMEDEPYYWNVGEAIIVKGEVMSHDVRKAITEISPQSASGIRNILQEKDLL
jgi:DNA-directed RNA polymerase subunit F